MELPDLELKLSSVVGAEADVTTVVGAEAATKETEKIQKMKQKQDET